MMMAPFNKLADLQGLRSAPPLSLQQRLQLQEELRQRVAACDWCTIGIMAPEPEVALACLHRFQEALGWSPLVAIETGEICGPVFLKGHQRSGQLLLRAEAGLGEGVLLTGHSDTDPEVEGTWGPLPLDCFTLASSSAHEPGAAGL